MRLALVASFVARCSSQSQCLLQMMDPTLHSVHVGPTRIPCVIHQTWKTHQLSDQQNRCVETWRSKNPTCDWMDCGYTGALFRALDLFSICSTRSVYPESSGEGFSHIAARFDFSFHLQTYINHFFNPRHHLHHLHPASSASHISATSFTQSPPTQHTSS